MQTNLPAVVITNYQQYIDAGYLTEMLLQYEDLPVGKQLFASIAYLDVKKTSATRRDLTSGVYLRIYAITLVLSINGVAYRYTLKDTNPDTYLAKKGLDLNNYGTPAGKDNHIRVLQQAFKDVIDHYIEKITHDIALNQ